MHIRLKKKKHGIINLQRFYLSTFTIKVLKEAFASLIFIKSKREQITVIKIKGSNIIKVKIT